MDRMQRIAELHICTSHVKTISRTVIVGIIIVILCLFKNITLDFSLRKKQS